ncbi:anion permease [Rothia kristinae]|uniref:Anion permease n=1 Tax=Rothia kristinae TaxID=37923 RepID=A0A199NSH7_9MICC|nr:anion permease [Rothia kristinae]OAX51760.1 anion permease [Rothia kristinae]
MSAEKTSTTAASEARRPPTGMIIKIAAILLVTVVVYFLPVPDGVDPRGMHMAGIFAGTILGLILQPLPTASVALIGLAAAMITGTMDASKEALQGFGNASIWLIVAAFFIADGFLITGLGRRIALMFVSVLGRSSLGLSYGMALTDLILAPATPSNTARAGGVVYPIIKSLAEVNGSRPDDAESRRRLGSYLSLTSVQVNTITSAMFVTAMAGNPLAVGFAAKQGVEISWGTWALAAIVPGLVALAVMPWLMSKIYAPTLKQTPEAPSRAKKELAELGPMSRGEWVMLATFVLLLVLWVLGSTLHVNATAAAFLGIAILLVTKVLTWKDMAKNSGAWSTLIFFSVLVGMATQLNDLGVIDWIGHGVASLVGGLPWIAAFAVLSLVYFYVHYLFASNTAQIVAMYSVFLGAAIATGAPPMLAALALGFIGNLFGGISHYASGPAGVIFGSGYVPTSEWFRVSFIASVANILIWSLVGGGWMFVLGMWH